MIFKGLIVLVLSEGGERERVNYHMTRTAPRALSLQNYLENPRMRAVRDGASRAGKSHPALLGSRKAFREMRANSVAIEIPTFRPK